MKVLEIYCTNYSEFKIIENKNSNSIFLDICRFKDVLYDNTKLMEEFFTTQENITAKELRDKHKKEYDCVTFIYHDLHDCFKVSFNNPKWDVSKDTLGYDCFKLTWDFENVET